MKNHAATAFAVLAVAALPFVTAAPVAAEEIVYFHSGKTLEIRAHAVEGGMVHVDLGSDGFLAFPRAAIDRIVPAGADVRLNESASLRPTRGLGDTPTPEGDYPVTGSTGARRSVVPASATGAPISDPQASANRRRGGNAGSFAGAAGEGSADPGRVGGAVRGYRRQLEGRAGATVGPGNSNRRVIGATKQFGSETAKTDVIGIELLPGKARARPGGGRTPTTGGETPTPPQQGGGSAGGESPEGGSGGEPGTGGGPER